MKIIDANIVLRYLLNDDEILFSKAVKIIENYEVQIPHFIIAEIVYVLEKVYKVPKARIHSTLEQLFHFENILIDEKEKIFNSLKYYSENNLDYADAVLLSFAKNNKVLTFDKKLNKLISEMK